MKIFILTLIIVLAASLAPSSKGVAAVDTISFNRKQNEVHKLLQPFQQHQDLALMVIIQTVNGKEPMAEFELKMTNRA